MKIYWSVEIRWILFVLNLILIGLQLSSGNTTDVVTKEKDKDTEYVHNIDSSGISRLPQLSSTLKMICNDLTELKNGDFVYISIQDKEQVYELSGTELSSKGSAYQVERLGDHFAFRHPTSHLLLFFSYPAYYIGVKKGVDTLSAFNAFEGCETTFKLTYHEKMNGFVMKSACDDRCLTVCDGFFSPGVCFRKDKCSAVRIYKIPAYSYQKKRCKKSKKECIKDQQKELQNITENESEKSKNTNKTSQKEKENHLNKLIEKAQVEKDENEKSVSSDTDKISSVFPQILIVKKILHRRKTPQKLKIPIEIVSVSSSITVSFTVPIVSKLMEKCKPSTVTASTGITTKSTLTAVHPHTATKTLTICKIETAPVVTSTVDKKCPKQSNLSSATITCTMNVFNSIGIFTTTTLTNITSITKNHTCSLTETTVKSLITTIMHHSTKTKTKTSLFISNCTEKVLITSVIEKKRRIPIKTFTKTLYTTIDVIE